jgi:hypothetical protein
MKYFINYIENKVDRIVNYKSKKNHKPSFAETKTIASKIGNIIRF